MTRDEIVDLLGRWLAALERRDADAYIRLYADEAVVDSPLGGMVSGHERIRAAFDAFFAAFPDAVFTCEPPCIDGDRAVVVSTISGTHTGMISGLPASRKPFRFSLVFVFDLRGGRIVRDRRVYDFTGLLVQIGMIKAKVQDH
jgi:steroid delta-isomerase-like uncharacterized protein